jgi:hypothetical protein
MLKLSTIGNATLIAYDDDPILATDPWICDEDTAYFGSWIGSNKIPKNYKDDIFKSKFLWFSHGHPDHINPSSLERFKGKKILIPDHYGSRIYKDLLQLEYDVEILKDKKWYTLSKNIRVQCVTNWIQDSILICEINDRLFINLNDAGIKYYSSYLKKLTKNYKHSYTMSISSYGDSDMINFYSEDGGKLKRSKENKISVGQQLSEISDAIGTNNIIPFSSFHQYQRSDSIWAQSETVPDEDYAIGLDKKYNPIKPFVEINCINGEITNINPEKITVEIKKPEIFGDNWSDQLEQKDIEKIDKYFLSKEKLNNVVGFIRLIVGKKEHIVNFKNNKKNGVTFEVPRNSLMKTVEYRIFDDLLIGNFMKTTLHNMDNLYQGYFNNIISKWSDNGGVDTESEFENYKEHYKEKIGQSFLYYNFLDQSKNFFLRFIPKNEKNKINKLARKMYNFLR